MAAVTSTATAAEAASLRQSAAAAVHTSNHVYVQSDEHAWVPARLLESSGGGSLTATVSIPVYATQGHIQSDGGRAALRLETSTIELKDYPSGALPLQNVDEEGRLLEVQDMVDLPFLHEVCVCVSFVLYCTVLCC
jgi:hypothetical protein